MMENHERSRLLGGLVLELPRLLSSLGTVNLTRLNLLSKPLLWISPIMEARSGQQNFTL